MPAALAARNLACRRGDRLLFTGLELDLADGALLHVTGANGTGKSSLMRILAGLLSSSEGDVSRSGSMALLDERLALDPEWPLGKALRFWERLDGCSDPSNIVAIMELEPLLDVPVRYLSTGQRKRAAFARLLCTSHDIWLLDEPFNGLDIDACAKVRSLTRLHCGGGGVCVIASHQDIGMDAHTLAIEDFAP
ncbi:heme ABC exporter ATP-binding protein CcmA [Erythrobacter litoralis]|uniref:ABC-type transport system ATPase component n=1 Tax=Erythrobacter litoralis (strain HTCC2594) TaxID=314225 RepID=Q2ND09_ERYLH|nr:heme ABC exporter ATP-binding protein CcmA [Erythrobacter litoralis]ABC62432.1 ABC-type transport system ATPase component [Erythrobacter litoralis HTCC2594]